MHENNIMRILFVLGLILIFQSTQAKENSFANKNYDIYKDTLTGKVINEKTGQPLAGATVEIPDLKMVEVTDSNGNYHFYNLHLFLLIFLKYSIENLMEAE